MRKMFVGGLHPSLTTKSLIGYFSKFGKIEKGIIMTDKNTGKSRGFGFIVFKEKETIDKIISNSNCHFLYGKWIECKRAQPKPQNVKMLNENSKNPNVNYYKNLNNQDNNILLKGDNNNQTENVNSNKENTNENLNNVIINNYFANKGQELLGDKYLYDKNLFMYQNYIPRDQIKYFLNNNYNNIINEMNNSNNNSSNNDNNSYSNKDSDTNISSLSQNIYISNHNNLEFSYISNNNNNNLNLTNSKESLNLSQEIKNNLNHNKNINNNNNINNINIISNNNQQLKFQNYFNNKIINPLTYNYFHYKLFDSYGEEISKLEPYSKTKEKIKLFPKDMNNSFDISKQNLLNNKIEVLSSLVYNKNNTVKKNNDISFGPDRNGARGEKSKSSGNSNESFRPY